jgi:hypothetical protein
MTSIEPSASIKNLNDDIEITKPIRDCFIKNGQHKKTALKKYIDLKEKT